MSTAQAALRRDWSTCQTVTVEQAAKVLGIGRTAAYDAVRRGDLYAIAIGGRLVVPIEWLERLLAGPGLNSGPEARLAS